jgi:hypothetical protein
MSDEFCGLLLTLRKCVVQNAKYRKKMFTGRAKLTRIIGDPDNQRPDKRSPTACT